MDPRPYPFFIRYLGSVCYLRLTSIDLVFGYLPKGLDQMHSLFRGSASYMHWPVSSLYPFVLFEYRIHFIGLVRNAREDKIIHMVGDARGSKKQNKLHRDGMSVRMSHGKRGSVPTTHEKGRLTVTYKARVRLCRLALEWVPSKQKKRKEE